ncbi:unnamed protein product [Heterobilharzia americana]|nr:unnamed protein product [Heterobilharzia americana]
MVRFSIVCTVGDSLRLGTLTDNSHKISLNTPGCLLYTRYGTVPFLSPDVYEEIDLIPGFSFASMNYVAQASFNEIWPWSCRICWLGKREAFLFQSDPTSLSSVAAISKDSVPVWATGGRLQLSITEYAKCVLAASPIAYQAPTDNETFLVDVNPKAKRCKNSVTRTTGYLKKLVEERLSREELAKTSLLVSIAGGHDLSYRLQSVAETDFSFCSGVVIDGVLQNLPVSSIPFKDYDNNTKSLREFLSITLPKIFAHIPNHLPRIITQIWQPYDIALATRSGCDLFDGSLPYRLSRSGIGWIYTDWNDDDDDDGDNQLIDISKPGFLEFPLKQPYTDDEQFSPIQPGCQCFACCHHTRVYISHLYTTQEMLAPMLLMIHNSHQYYRFFADLRRSISLNKIDTFVNYASNWHFPYSLVTVDKTNEFNSTINTDDDL